MPGGILVRDDVGRILGALGVSGDTSDRDELCAIRAVRTAQLVPNPADEPAGWRESLL